MVFDIDDMFLVPMFGVTKKAYCNRRKCLRLSSYAKAQILVAGDAYYGNDNDFMANTSRKAKVVEVLKSEESDLRNPDNPVAMRVKKRRRSVS